MRALNTSRRQFLGGLFAAGIVPKPTWADAGSPAFLSAAAKPDGSFVLCGIGADLKIRFQRPLPARGHAAAAHPTRPEAVAFARRPGTFAVVIACDTGRQKAVLTAPAGRHFYGHGAFSSDGGLLFTTENDFEAGCGRIGVWDADHGYKRIDEWDSGGIGPHDIKPLPDTETLVIANGGIDTHPDSGRTKLNIPTMHPNLTYIEDGAVQDTARLPRQMQKNSIRHLAVRQDGAVAFGMQWQGDAAVSALVGIHQRGTPISLLHAPSEHLRQMEGYIGSIAFCADGTTLAATSPRGGRLHLYETRSKQLARVLSIPDVSGVAMSGDDFVVSSGEGHLVHVGGSALATPTYENGPPAHLDPSYLAHSNLARSNLARSNLAWDNHLVPV